MDFSEVKAITIPEGNVYRILSGSTVLWKKTRLPDEYQEVEYIEGTGTQYIDTGYYPNQNTKFEIRYLILEAGCAPAGVRWTVAPNSQTFGFFASASVGTTCYFGRANDNKYVTFANKNEYSQIADGLLDITRVSINTFSATVSRDQFVSTFPMYLFSLDIRGEASSPSKMRLYSASISESGSTKREFIPCYRKIDRKPGLYDLANGVFYTNDGTGEFNVGPVVITLPDEYQRVEYIESNGTQYIDTGIVPTDNTKMDLRLFTTCTGSFYVAGARGSSTIYFGQTGTQTNAAISATVNATSVTAMTEGGTKWSRSANGQTYEIMLRTNGDGTYDYSIVDETNERSYTSNGKAYPPLGTVNTNILVFALRPSNIISGTNKLYYFRLYESDAIVCDLVPCYRKIDNVAGVYDVVNDVFYTNAGSGTFTVGPDV